MRATIAYTTARILLFVVALGGLYLAGSRGLPLIALALLASGIVSFVLLSRQRDAMSGAMVSGLRGIRGRVSDLSSRIDEGATLEDQD